MNILVIRDARDTCRIVIWSSMRRSVQGGGLPFHHALFCIIPGIDEGQARML